MEKLRTWVNEGYLVNFICSGDGAIGKMQHLFDESGLAARRDAGDILSGLFKHEGKGELLLRDGKISKGFVAAHLKWVLLSDEEVFGPKVRKRKARPSHEGYFLRSFGELKEGDFVVHADHGIGVYRGLEKLSLGEMENDFLRLEYLEGDKLFIPVDRLDQIQRYIGPDGHSPKIDKLGGASWEAAKRKVKRSVEEIAEELVSLYAARDGLERTPFAPTDAYYDDFSSSFAFEETPDQAKTIEEVNFDMSDAKPMDRLICGDAGFGKTEVAVRAAFRAVMEGKQAAVLVPTTILAEQHFRTFSRRLEKYPVRIDVLNRFKTKKEQQQVIEDLRKGVLDIVVGTHRLLQKDVSFKDLGLVVVDE
jgi:transcription-repair coupling factor (superfamily II helicase)